MLTTKFENVKMYKNKIFFPFFLYFELSNIVNSSFNLRKPILDSKVVRKILRSLLRRFRLKITTLNKSNDIDSIRIDELVGSTQTYEMTLPNYQKPKHLAFKTFENKKEDTEIPYNIIRDELDHMAKRIKMVMKFNRKFYKNEEFGEGKIPEQSSKEKDKGSFKGKKI